MYARTPRPDFAAAAARLTRLQLVDAACTVYRARLALLSGLVSPPEALAACLVPARIGGDTALHELSDAAGDGDPHGAAIVALEAIGDLLEVALTET